VTTLLRLARDPAIASALALALAGVWLAAALPKLRRPRDFARAVAGYALLPPNFAPAAAAALLLSELGIAAGLVLGACRIAPLAVAALASAALLALYGAAIAVNLARGRAALDCGCSLGRARPLSRALVVRNAALALLSLVAAAPSLERPLGAVDALTAAAGGLTLLALYLAADTAFANAERLAALARPA
jgi:hypothetical protein